jgi:signal transduction histidine kinase
MGQIKKVLIAEDSPTQALKLQMILEEKGYDVIHGKNGKEALSLIDEKDPPDLVISDIVMPEMDGYELCSQLKQNKETKEIPVILLTQLSNPEDVIKGLQSGADNFISKPYSDEFLFERINDILLNKEMRRRSPNLDIAMEIYFGGQKYKLNSDRLQILDLLLSTYYNAINKNRELEEKNEELKQLHSELKSNNIQLKKLNDEKNQLLGIAAHDLRSPLGNISSYIDLIDYSIDENTFDDQEEMFSTIKMMLDHMLKMISDVLDYSKIESGKLNLEKEPSNLIQFLNQTIKLSNILGSSKNITVQPLYSMEEIIIEADFKKLKQVMDNLLSNAFKYSKRGTTVEVDVKILENEVQISVADQGQGIPQKELNKLFQPFSTTSVRTTEGEQSTGLGLVSVKKIVETHGGRIWVESEVGLGSIFYFTLPYNP